MPKIKILSNEDDWMQIYKGDELIFNDHISNLNPLVFLELVGLIVPGIETEYQFQEFD